MKIFRLLLPLFAVVCILAHLVGDAPALAAEARVVSSCGSLSPALTPGSGAALVMDVNGNLCTSASVTASIAGFSPASVGTPITATTGGATGSLPAGAVVVATNTGTTNPAFCALGASASTSWQEISPNGGWFAFTVGSATQLTCVTSTGSTQVNLVGGSGLPTGTGGGGGGSSGGNVNVTEVGGAAIALGQAAMAASLPVAIASNQSAVPVSGTFWQTTQPVSLASAPLPSGAATAANQEVTAAGTSASSAQAVQGVAGGVALPVSLASAPLPSGAATSANQTNASQKTQIVDGSGNVISSTSNALNVQCANCSGSGVSTADSAAFTAGSSAFVGMGGEYDSSLPTAIATGHQAMAAITQYRSLWTDWYNSAGTEMGTSTSPVQVSLANTGSNTNGLAVTGAAGAFVDGAIATIGTKADSAYSGSGSASEIAALKGIYAAATGAIPAGSNNIGGVELIDSGGTNKAAINSSGQIGVQALPAQGAHGTLVGAVEGAAASGATAGTYPDLVGGLAVNAEPTPVSNGQAVRWSMGLEGKGIVLPYANKENMLRGNATSINTSATTLIAAQGAGIKIYVTDLACSRNDAGTSADTVTLNDTESTGNWSLDIPNVGGGGGFIKQFETPLVVAANTALTFQMSAGITTARCSAGGYAGS